MSETLVQVRLEYFTLGYIEGALLTSSDGDGDDDTSLSERYDISDIDPETLGVMIADCTDFQGAAADLLEALYETRRYTNDRGYNSPEEMAGYNFWLTRNGHGAGFWDEGDDLGDQLTAVAKKFDEFSLYVGDDGIIYGTAG